LIADILSEVSKIFLDTAPVIYYIERSVNFFPIVDEFFQGLKSRNIPAVVSPTTLAECLVMPFKLNNIQMQQNYINFLTNTREIEMVSINPNLARTAAELRATYGLKLPDALQVATAIASGCDGFLTNDTSLKRVRELQILVVEELEV
jgi:predicted nucleic acid-binding protein